MRFIALCLTVLIALPATAKAQALLETYVAKLSATDHFNSNGVRLTQPWQIIRQDRANYHRYGIRDPEDQYDSFFSSINNRNIAERMLRDGYIPQNVANMIVNGAVTVVVEIYGHGNTGTYIRVNVY